MPKQSVVSQIDLSFFSAEIWGLIGVCLLVTTVAGFVAGLWCARRLGGSNPSDRVRRFGETFETLLEKLDEAQVTGEELQQFTRPSLSADAMLQLNSRRSNLSTTLGRLADTLAGVVTPRGKSRPASEIVWVEGPECPRTGLPMEPTFEQNLAELITWQEAGEAGVLFVEVERFGGLIERFGDVEATGLLRTVGKLVACGLRDCDYLARLEPATLAVLLPETDRHTGVQIAESIRAAVRGHCFCLEASGVEVMVTAGFGYAVVEAGDHPDLICHRVKSALAEAKRQGRNQLRIHAQNDLVERLTA